MMKDKFTLLIVDDEEDIRGNLFDYIEYQGFNALEAENGAQALSIIEQNEVDLIVSDLMMPEMNGLQMLEEILRREIEVPVIIMTAFGTMEYAINAMKNGAADFITKPIELPYLHRIINKVLQKSQMEQKIREQQRQLDDDLQHAATIQQCMLPHTIDNDFLSLRYRYQPLIAIGGDYLSVYSYNDKLIAAAIYDVSGHGVSAALTASLVHNHLQELLPHQESPCRIIEQLNKRIVANIGQTSMFITMILALIDAEKSRITVCNAGHPDLLIWRETERKVVALSSQITPVGFGKEILGNLCDVQMDISTRDRIVFYTDGFSESRNAQGDMLGRDGLQAWVADGASLQPESFIQQMFQNLNHYLADEPEDDLTLMIVDVK